MALGARVERRMAERLRGQSTPERWDSPWGVENMSISLLPPVSFVGVESAAHNHSDRCHDRGGIPPVMVQAAKRLVLCSFLGSTRHQGQGYGNRRDGREGQSVGFAWP